jgi:Family of unknown function (DUF5677)
MAEPTPAELKAYIRACATAATKLKHALKDEEIYVATRASTSVVPFCHLTKAFQIHAAVLTLCKAGFGSEAFALSRSILEMAMALRWITNDDQVNRSDSFAFFGAKRKQYLAVISRKYSPANPALAGAIQYVENLYKQYTDKYDSFKFWSNVPNNLRAMAAEPEILYGPQAPPNNDDLWHYDLPYSMASDYVHCTAVAMADSFPPASAPYEVPKVREPKLVRDAAFSATQWLFTIMLRVDAYRNLDMRDQIDKAYEPFKKFVDAHLP